VAGAVVLVASGAGGARAAWAAEPAVASTAQIDLSIEPAIPDTAVPIVLGEGEKPALVAGKATPTAYQLYSFQPPAGRLFEIRLFAKDEGSVAMQIFRGDAKTPEVGAGPKDGTLMWMSSSAGETLRILVRGMLAGETPYQIGAKLYPKSAGEE
jgi:hypothetical protein